MSAPTAVGSRTPTTAGLAALERLLAEGGGTAGLDTPVLPAERVLQALLTRGHTGRLVLADGRGELVFGHGKVLRARLDHLWGLDAVVRGLALTDGRYHLSLERIAVEPEFQCTVMELEQIVFPRLARFARTVQRGVPLAARLQVEFTRLAAVLRGMPDEVNQVVRLFDGQRRVRDVVLDCRLDEGLCLEVATRLYLMGVLAPARDAPALDAPRKAPRFFEPRARLAEETMAELFGPTGEISAATMPALADMGDWFEPQRGPGLEVADPTDGWAAAALDEAGAKLHLELDPELSRQLDAFRVPVATEGHQTRAVDRPAREFSRGQEDDGQGTPNLESVTADAQLPSRTLTPPMMPVVLLEEALTPSRHVLPDQRRIATPPMMPAVEPPAPVEVPVVGAPAEESPAVESPQIAAPVVEEPATESPAREPAEIKSPKLAAPVVPSAAVESPSRASAAAPRGRRSPRRSRRLEQSSRPRMKRLQGWARAQLPLRLNPRPRCRSSGSRHPRRPSPRRRSATRFAPSAPRRRSRTPASRATSRWSPLPRWTWSRPSSPTQRSPRRPTPWCLHGSSSAGPPTSRRRSARCCWAWASKPCATSRSLPPRRLRWPSWPLRRRGSRRPQPRLPCRSSRRSPRSSASTSPSR